MSGVNIDIKDLTMEEVYYMEYFSMKRRNAEETTKFKVLFEGLTKLVQALAKSMRGRL